MSQIPEQILNQPAAQFLGPLGQGMSIIPPAAYQPNIQQQIPQPQNIPIGVGGEDQKNTESN
jgi:hypothetical protein